MSDSFDDNPLDSIEQQAAAWVLRCDRGLTPAEQDEYSEWLAADPRHGAQLARHRRHWSRLDHLAQWRPEHGSRPNPDLLAPPLRTRLRRWAPAAVTLAAAAVVAGVFFFLMGIHPQPLRLNRSASPVAPTAPAAGPRVLADGTTVELNRGAAITVRFTTVERRIHLERGEAHFAVTKDPLRPFIVIAGGVEVRAIGTAFNVRVDAAAVEVLVTEGNVQVNAPEERAPVARLTGDDHASHAGRLPGERPAPVASILGARQRLVVPLMSRVEPPQIATLTPGEIERVLAWQHRLLDFNASPLTEIVAEFNRRNVVQLVVIDPELASIRISAAFRSDNIEGFVHLLEAGFGARAERRGEAEIVLRKAAASPPAK